MADIADGVIVGSAIIKLLEKYGPDAPEIYWCLCKNDESCNGIGKMMGKNKIFSCITI
jgi:tryptophan synthase alpha subunit